MKQCANGKCKVLSHQNLGVEIVKIFYREPLPEELKVDPYFDGITVLLENGLELRHYSTDCILPFSVKKNV
jgi:hypothetical protein